MGATFDNITASWEPASGPIVKFFGLLDRIDTGFLIVGSKKGVDEYFDRLKKTTGSKTPL